MTMKQSDPYKDNPYGRIKGSKKESSFTVGFSEARIYAIDKGYAVVGHTDKYENIVRSFKSELPLKPGYHELCFYAETYEERVKKDGNYESVSVEPSQFEKSFCDYIKDSESELVGEDKTFKLIITHISDTMMFAFSSMSIEEVIQKNVFVEAVTPSGNLPKYTPYSGSKGYSKGSGYSRGASLEDKLKTIKTELADFIVADGYDDSKSLGALVEQVCNEHAGKDEFLAHYFDTLQAVVR